MFGKHRNSLAELFKIIFFKDNFAGEKTFLIKDRTIVKQRALNTSLTSSTVT